MVNGLALAELLMNAYYTESKLQLVGAVFGLGPWTSLGRLDCYVRRN